MKAQAHRQNAKEAVRERDVRTSPRVTPAGVSRLQRKAACACGGGCPRCQESKLQVSSPGDSHEQEADRVAGEVMRMAEPQGAAIPAASAEVGAQAGEPLPASAREFFEPRFGHSFNDVRVHTDARAAQQARSLDALAYTVGTDVVFADGQYAPETQAGRTLLAHELTHVVQQRGGGASGVQRKETAGCEGTQSSDIATTVSQAHTDLETAIGQLATRPLTQAVKDAMWLAFRDESNATADNVMEKLGLLRDNIKTADYTCVGPTHPDHAAKCPGKIFGYVSAQDEEEGVVKKHIGPIHLCLPRFTELASYQRSRAVIHEGAHRFLNVEDTGYFAMQDDLKLPDCKESPRRGTDPLGAESGTEGDPAGVRLDNADAYACFVHFLVYAKSKDLTDTAREYKGGELRIEATTRAASASIYTETETPSEPSFRIVGVPENSGFQFRWKFVADGVRYSPLRDEKTTAVKFDESNKEVYIGPGARSTLGIYGSKTGVLICEILLVGPYDPFVAKPEDDKSGTKPEDDPTGAKPKEVKMELSINKGQDPDDPRQLFRQQPSP